MVWLLKHMGIDEFRTLFGNSPTTLAYVDAAFGSADGGLRAEFIESVDESPHSPRQWIAALRVIGEWLDARGLHLPLNDRIGYIRCAAESASGAGVAEDLPSLVMEMLDRYGCERAVERDGRSEPLA